MSDINSQEFGKTCSVCGAKNEISHKHCIKCGSYLLDGVHSGAIYLDAKSIERAKKLSKEPDLICPVCKTRNKAINKICVECGAWLQDEYWKPSQANEGYNHKLPRVPSQPISEIHTHSTKLSGIGLFWWVAIGFFFLLLFAGGLKSISNWMLMTFLISIGALMAGLVSPQIIKMERYTRKDILELFLPIAIICFALFGTLSQNSVIPSKIVPSAAYDNTVDKTVKNFVWEYDGQTFNWQIEASNELLKYDRKINGSINTFFHSNGYTQTVLLNSAPEDVRKMIMSQTTTEQSSYAAWITEPSNSAWIAQLADNLNQMAQENNYNYFQRAEFVLSFVGDAIPYQITQFAQLPAQTVFDNGDCKDKSILLAAILKALGYHVALFAFPADDKNPGHMAVGVLFKNSQVPKTKILDYYKYLGQKYYFAETTSPNWPLGKSSLKKPATIIVIGK